MSDSVGKVSLDLELENDLLGGLQNAVAEMKGQLQKAISGIMKSCKLELDTSAADKQVESLGGKLKDSMKAASKVAGDALRRETQQAAQEAERSIGKITEGARNASKNRAPPDESSILRQMERVAALMDAQAYRAETLSNGNLRSYGYDNRARFNCLHKRQNFVRAHT